MQDQCARLTKDWDGLVMTDVQLVEDADIWTAPMAKYF